VDMTPQLSAWMEQSHVSLIVVANDQNLAVVGYRTRTAAYPAGLPEGILDIHNAKGQAEAKEFEVSESNDIINGFLPPRHIEGGGFHFTDIRDLRWAFPAQRSFRTDKGTIGILAVIGPADEAAYNATPAAQRVRPDKITLRMKRIRPELIIQAAVAMLPDLSGKYSKFAQPINAGDAPAALKASDDLFPSLESFCFLIQAAECAPAFDDALVRLTKARVALAEGDLTVAKGVIQDFNQLGPVLSDLAQSAAPRKQASTTRPDGEGAKPGR
jgi:hypothetical protein